MKKSLLLCLCLLIQLISVVQSLESLLHRDLPKCCGLDEVVDFKTKACVKAWGEAITQSWPLFLGPELFHMTASYAWNMSGLPTCDTENPSLHYEINFNQERRDFADPKIPLSSFFLVEDRKRKFVEDRHRRKHLQFCLDHLVSGDQFKGTFAAFCQRPKSELCQERPCFHLCCPQRHVYDHERQDCQESNQSMPLPPIRELRTDKVTGVSSDVMLFEEPIDCPRRYVRDILMESDNATIYENGDLFVHDHDQVFQFQEFCINYQRVSESTLVQISFRVCDQIQQDHLALASQIRWLSPKVKRFILSVSSFASVVFYALTFGVVLFRRRQALFGIMILFLVANRAVFGLVFCVIQFTPLTYLKSNPVLCQVMGFVLHFSYMSSSCWLACLGVNVWITFRRIRNPRPCPSTTSVKAYDGVKHPHFKYYLLCAKGFPLAMLVVTLVMHFLPEHAAKDFIRPAMGERRCFIQNDLSALFLYFHLLNLPCTLIAIFTYLCTSYNLYCGVWSERRMVSATIEKSNLRVKNVMVVKLFFVLGVTWLMEVVSVVLSTYGIDSLIFFVFDVINALQGFILFVVMVTDSATSASCRSWLRSLSQRQADQAEGADDPEGVKESHNFRLRDENSVSDMGSRVQIRPPRRVRLRSLFSLLFKRRRNSYNLKEVKAKSPVEIAI